MIKYKINDDGTVEQIGSDDTALKRKAFEVEKAGTRLHFGSIVMVKNGIVDLGVSASTLYQRDWSTPYETSTGYKISKIFVEAMPTPVKRKGPKV